VGSTEPDATSAADAPSAETPADAATSDARPADANSDGGANADGGSFGDGGSKLLVSGDIQLVGSGPDSCTNQVPAPGDRWCAFVKVSAGLNPELWVIDVTKAAAGVPAACDGTDTSCLRLSTALYVDPTNAFRGDGFDGDTLTFAETPSQRGGGFLGNIFAWRPGWAAPHNLTGNGGLVCNGHALGKAAVCLQNPTPDATNSFIHTAELHAGILDDVGTPLPLIDDIIVVVSAAEANTGAARWSARLAPDGKSVAWSTRATDTGTEDLHVQTLGLTTKVDVAQDVSQWQISADSAKWYWLKSFNYASSGAPAGTLQSAPYPGGANPVMLAQNAGDFTLAGPGVYYRTQVAAGTGAGNLLVTPNSEVPATVAMIDTTVQFVFGATPDGASVSYTKTVQSAANSFLFDLYVSGPGRAAPCVLTASPTAFLPPQFLSDGSMLAWGRVNTLTNNSEGIDTAIAACASSKFASSLYSMTSVSNEGYVFLDDVNPNPSIDEATLRYAKVAGGFLPSRGTPIQMRAGLTYATLLPSLPAVVYVVSTVGAGAGLYLNATLPFTTTH
jgi:hypothetical protein